MLMVWTSLVVLLTVFVLLTILLVLLETALIWLLLTSFIAKLLLKEKHNYTYKTNKTCFIILPHNYAFLYFYICYNNLIY